jgi:hypothetical protein
MRFRGSHQRATAAIERAFDLLPSIDTCCVARAVAQIRATFKYVGSASVRRGFGQSYGNPVYLAFPEWQGDTIAFTPVPQRELQRAPPPTMSVAIRMQRNRLHSIASKRVTLARDNSDALAFLGETMELRGDNLAADTIHRARVLATDRSRILRLTIAEIWLKLKRALPSNERELVMVRALADSLMLSAADVSGNDASLLASVAAVTGNVDLATRLVKRVDQQSEYPELPQEVLANAQAFLVLAVMGGSPDSLRVLEARLTNGIANDVLPQHQAMMRNMFISRGASFAFPGYRSPTLRTLDTNIALIGAETAILRGDSRRAHDILMRAQAARANVPPASLTLDGLYTEAWLLASLGDSANALARIAPTMDAIQSISSAQLSRAIVAGSLLQAMRLRQSLLTSAGNHREAAEWKRATAILTDPRRP